MGPLSEADPPWSRPSPFVTFVFLKAHFMTVPLLLANCYYFFHAPHFLDKKWFVFPFLCMQHFQKLVILFLHQFVSLFLSSHSTFSTAIENCYVMQKSWSENTLNTVNSSVSKKKNCIIFSSSLFPTFNTWPLRYLSCYLLRMRTFA